MSKSNDELKIKLDDGQGGNWVSHDTYGAVLKRISNLEERKDWATNEILELRGKVRELEKPKRIKAILALVSLQKIPRSSRFFVHRLSYDEFDWQTWNELVNQGKIEKVKRGKATLYKFKEVS